MRVRGHLFASTIKGDSLSYTDSTPMLASGQGVEELIGHWHSVLYLCT